MTILQAIQQVFPAAFDLRSSDLGVSCKVPKPGQSGIWNRLTVVENQGEFRVDTRCGTKTGKNLLSLLQSISFPA